MITVKTKPTVEPVTLEEVKLHCRVDHDDEDDLLENMMAAARHYAEFFTRRAFVTQTIQYSINVWPSGDTIYLPRPPVQSVTSVKWYDEDGSENTLTENTDYLVDTDSEPAQIVLPWDESWPTGTLNPKQPIIIEYVAGYPPTDDETPDLRENVPGYIKAAIKLYVAALYENREAVLPSGHIGQRLPLGLEALLYQERVFWTEELNK